MIDETDRLIAILEDHHVRPDVLESGLAEFSDEAKDAAAARVASAPGPAPGQVLARLLLIRTARNEADIATALRTGLQAPDAAARKFAIYGLQALGLPEATDAARAALDDDDDQVVVAAASVLLPEAAGDPQVADALRDAYEARVGNEEFHASVSLLKARLIDPGEPT
jgi:HEAT repeat protein